MTYRALPENLHSKAEAVRTYLRDELGVQKIAIEEGLDPDIEWRPTLSGITSDHHIVCVEVTSGVYTDALNGFVLDCMTRGLPVRLYIAFPESEVLAEKVLKTFSTARDRGVGIIQVRGAKCKVLVNPVELSLASVRRVNSKDFIQKYRQPMRDAEATFLNGDPVSGCSRVFAEIEALSRKVAAKCVKKGWWSGSGIKKISKHPWKDLCQKWMTDMDFKKSLKECANLTEPLLATIVGLTKVRNETGPHKPKSNAALINRDRDLRTRFEHAVQVFIELQNAARPLRV